MEENIKILEELAKEVIHLNSIEIPYRKKQAQAIENLLKAYKEDEKVIDKLCSDIAMDYGYWKEDVIEVYRKKVKNELWSKNESSEME